MKQVVSVTENTTTDIKDIDFVPPFVQIQDGANSNQYARIPLFNINADGLVLDDMRLLLPVNSDTSLIRADAAITKIANYITIYGVLQNRMEHAINHIQLSSENLSSDESRIKETDFAKEMMNLIKTIY